MRLKWCALPVLLATVLFLSPDESQGQGFRFGGQGGGPGGPGGGPPGGPGGGRGFDPDAMWDRMAQGQDSINLNDPRFGFMKGMMERQGTPLPPNGILTKQQFTAGMQARMAQGGGFGGRGSRGERGGPGSFGGPGGPGGSPPTVMTFQSGPDGRPVMVSGPGMPPTMSSQPMSFRSGPGGFDSSQMTDDQIRMMMRRYDTNGDGRITPDEIAANERARDLLRFDSNGDGSIDTGEYRLYFADRVSGMTRGRDGGDRGRDGGGPPGFSPGGMPPGQMPNFSGGNGSPNTNSTSAEDDFSNRREVFRFGKLPKNVPGWFLDPASNRDGLDTDKDGMIGLYEWRRAGKPTAEFVAMDLNKDGYLSAREWMKYQEALLAPKTGEDGESLATSPASGRPGGGPPSMGSGGPGGGRTGPGGREGRTRPSRNPFSVPGR